MFSIFLDVATKISGYFLAREYSVAKHITHLAKQNAKVILSSPGKKLLGTLPSNLTCQFLQAISKLSLLHQEFSYILATRHQQALFCLPIF
jgi:hypothetical protein